MCFGWRLWGGSKSCTYTGNKAEVVGSGRIMRPLNTWAGVIRISVVLRDLLRVLLGIRAWADLGRFPG